MTGSKKSERGALERHGFDAHAGGRAPGGSRVVDAKRADALDRTGVDRPTATGDSRRR
ncbi:MAG: hypothetical protein KF764_19620 [Labilithrix sp.]|nr:hypothetical protein [Labilithrix sp.]MBX3222687.1 hypothetical protein [Labilithrix sp.]